MGCKCENRKHRRHISSTSTISLPLRLLLLLQIFLFFGHAACQMIGEGKSSCRASRCAKKYHRRNPKDMEGIGDVRPPRFSAPEAHQFYTDLVRPCQAAEALERCLKKARSKCKADLYYHQYQRMCANEKRKFACDKKQSYFNRLHKEAESGNITAIMRMSRREKRPDPPVTTTTIATTTTPPSPAIDERCVYKSQVGDRYSHCSLFGDPHLRTFSDRFFTCNIEGTWALIHNPYLTVMASHVLAVPGSAATITSKITVQISGDEHCADQLTYVASTDGAKRSNGDALPTAFEDGSTRSRRGGVEIIEVTPGLHVEIVIPYIDTRVVIRHVANYLTFATRMPSKLVRRHPNSEQLCEAGCRADASNRLAATSTDKFARPVGQGDGPPQFHVAATTPTVEPVLFREEEARVRCRRALLESRGISEEPSASPEEEEEEVDEKEEKEDAVDSYVFPHDPSSFSFNLLQSSTGENGNVPPKRRSHKRHASWRRKHRQPVKRDLSSSSADAAESPCVRDNTNYNFYFDSCVFDLVTTGDANLTLAAGAALNDAIALHDDGEDAPGSSVQVIERWPSVQPCPIDQRAESETTADDGDVKLAKSAEGNRVSPSSSATVPAVSTLLLILTLLVTLLHVSRDSST